MHDFWSAYFRAHLVIGLLPFWLLVLVADSFRAQALTWSSPSQVADLVSRYRNWKALAFALLCWFCLFLLIVKVF